MVISTVSAQNCISIIAVDYWYLLPMIALNYTLTRKEKMCFWFVIFVIIFSVLTGNFTEDGAIVKVAVSVKVPFTLRS